MSKYVWIVIWGHLDLLITCNYPLITCNYILITCNYFQLHSNYFSTSRAFERTLEHLSTPSNCRVLYTPYFDCFSRPTPYRFGYGHRHTPYTSRDLETFPTSHRTPLYYFRGLQNFHSKNIYGFMVLWLWFYGYGFMVFFHLVLRACRLGPVVLVLGGMF